jgi:hypothetical protein
MPANKIKDESHDKDYFTITPRLVWALADNPYQYTFWCVVKDIAGDRGQCFISTPDLGTLTMMSAGKAHECRKALIEKGLLLGQLIRDPGFPQPVWHLRIPNLWERNTRWCQDHQGIKDRILFKMSLKGAGGKELSCGESSQELSCDEKGLSPDERYLSPHEKGLSPHERYLSPHEKGLSPHERKKIQKEDLKEEPKENGSSSSELWEKFFHCLESQMDTNRSDRLFYKMFLKDLIYIARENGTIFLSPLQGVSCDLLNSRMSSKIEKMFNGFPELAGAKVQFVEVIDEQLIAE